MHATTELLGVTLKNVDSYLLIGRRLRFIAIDENSFHFKRKGLYTVGRKRKLTPNVPGREMSSLCEAPIGNKFTTSVDDQASASTACFSIVMDLAPPNNSAWR